MVFKRIEKNRKKSAYAVEQILNAIRCGEYRVGDKLPSERVIAKQMGISRNSVREALSALQIMGVIESKPGDGTYVCDSTKNKSRVDHILTLVRENEDLCDIWEARKEIEASLVKFAVDRANVRAINRIQYYLEKMRRAIDAGDSAKYLNIDKKFHLAIAKAADNSLLEGILHPLVTITDEYLLENINLDHLLTRCKESLKEHEAILNAIKSRDEVAGIKAIYIHFEKVERYFGRKYLKRIPC